MSVMKPGGCDQGRLFFPPLPLWPFCLPTHWVDFLNNQILISLSTVFLSKEQACAWESSMGQVFW
jgi:hypothetical protein